MSRLEVFLGHDGDWHWRLIAPNAEIVARGEGYRRRADLLVTCKKYLRPPFEIWIAAERTGQFELVGSIDE